MKNITLIICLAAITLTGCGKSEPIAKDELIIKHQIQALEKANQVEGLLKQAEQERRQQMDESGI
mgnify:FL=1|tara:strand:- start:1970 stop:2164 length:195 start_codon:yes stop_codon:yes gene_type:complete